MNNAKEVIEKFWEIQDEGDYTKVIELFSEDAVFEDPIYGTFNGKEEILEFMKKKIKKCVQEI
jgi:ketosteroid isomerase-like protein